MKKRIFITIMLITILATPVITANADESNTEPSPLKIRKVTMEEGQLYLWLYVHTNIILDIRYDEMDGTFTHMYTYDSNQLKIPLDPQKLTEAEINLLTDPTYTQKTIRERLTKDLKKHAFLSQLSQNIDTETKQVNQREQEQVIKSQNLIKTMKNKVLLGVSPLSLP